MKKQQLRVENLHQNRNYKVRLSVISNGQRVDATRSFDVQTPRFLEDSMSAYTTASYISRDYTRDDKFTDGVFKPGAIQTTSQKWTVKSVKVVLKPVPNSCGDNSTGVFLNKSMFEFEIVFDKGLPKGGLSALSGFTGVLGVLLNGGGKLPDGAYKAGNDTIKFSKTWSKTIPELSSATWKPFNSSPSISLAIKDRLHGYFDDPSYNELYNLSKNPNTTASKALWSSASLTVTDTSLVGAKYIAPTTTSTYTNTCSITSKIANDAIYESLYWDENVRDYVYFFIADDKSYPKKWFYFETKSDIKPSTIYQGKVTGISVTNTNENGSIIINNGKISDSPPDAPFSNNDKRGKFRANCTYFTGSDVTTSNFGVETIYVRFAIARYVKTNGVWKTGKWIPGSTSASKIFSSTEALSGK
jgi:hypothetical protein